MKIFAFFILFMSFNLLAQSNLSAPSFGKNAVVSFENFCPIGWSDIEETRGRLILGAGNGNTDALGDALATRVIGSMGGLEYTTGLPASTSIATDSVPGPGLVYAAPPSSPSSNYPVYSDASFFDSIMFGNQGSSNLPPFYSIVYCRPN